MLWRMRMRARWPRSCWHACRGLERSLLGRGTPCVRRAVNEAIALASDAAWCMRCGVPLPALGGMPRHVRPGQGPRCRACDLQPRFEAFVRLGTYRAPLSGMIRRAKEHAWHAALAELGWRLGDESALRLRLPDQGTCVVPVPTSPWRRFARRADHAHELAMGVCRRLGIPQVRALRMGVFERQAGLGRRDRLTRAPRMVLAQRAARGLHGRGVLLVDDVRTTGATLEEAAKLLRGAGVAWVAPAVVCVAETAQMQQNQAFME